MNTLRRLSSAVLKINLNKIASTRIQNYSLYEPTYLEGMKSKIPLYDTLNIQLRGYDYPVLENFQKLVHHVAKNMEINVEEAWAVPPQHLRVVTYKPNSEVVNSQYDLKLYERNVQVTDIPAAQLTTLIRAIEASCPVGVTINIVEHEDWHEEIRYIPDNELNKLKQELDDMGGPLKKK